jgi:hypothetical protein
MVSRAGIDTGLTTGGGFFDAHLGQSGFDRLGHAAELFDFLDVAHAFSISASVRAST